MDRALDTTPTKEQHKRAKEAGYMWLRTLLQNLYESDDPRYRQHPKRALIAYRIRRFLIAKTGWSRGKRLENGKYSFLER